MKIAVVGLGYVGLSNAVLLSQNHEVVAVDVTQERVEMVNACKSPIEDAELENYLATRKLDLTATTDLKPPSRAPATSSWRRRRIMTRWRTSSTPPRSTR